jgi:hypothetical protein
MTRNSIERVAFDFWLLRFDEQRMAQMLGISFIACVCLTPCVFIQKRELCKRPNASRDELANTNRSAGVKQEPHILGCVARSEI